MRFSHRATEQTNILTGREVGGTHKSITRDQAHKREGGGVKKVGKEREGSGKKENIPLKCIPLKVSIFLTTGVIYYACYSHLNCPANCWLISTCHFFWVSFPSSSGASLLYSTSLFFRLFVVRVSKFYWLHFKGYMASVAVQSFLFLSVSVLSLGKLSSLFSSILS